MKSKTYSIPSVGDILVCKHFNTKRLTIKLKAGENPKVVIPALMPFDMGFRFAVEKQEWIKDHAAKLAQTKPAPVLLNGAFFQTRFHQVQSAFHPHKNVVSRKNGNTVTLFFPEGESLESDKNQKLIRSFILELLRKEAKTYLPGRTRQLAVQFGFQCKNITVKNLKTRWGSCSAINNINLNLHLMRLPEHLSDFIILHELCHTRHKNHGAQFHELLNKLCGDEKRYNKELKKYHIQF